VLAIAILGWRSAASAEVAQRCWRIEGDMRERGSALPAVTASIVRSGVRLAVNGLVSDFPVETEFYGLRQVAGCT